MTTKRFGLGVGVLCAGVGVGVVMTGCTFFKVNGKPLSGPNSGGGGGSTSTTGSSDSTAPIDEVVRGDGSGRYTDEYGNTTPDWAPAWCNQYRGATGTGYLSIDDDLASEGYFADRPLRDLAQAQCEFRKSSDDTAKIRGIAGRYAAEFAKAWGLSAAEFEPILALSLAQRSNDQASSEACDQVPDVDLDIEARDRDHALAIGSLACGRTRGDYDWFDGSAASDVAEVNNCAPWLQSSIKSTEGKSSWRMIQFASCNTIASRLDRRRYIEEIDAAKLPTYARLMAVGQFQRATDAITAVRGYYSDLAKKDPTYQALLFDVPAAAVAALAKLRKDNAMYIDPIARVIKNRDSKRIVAGMKDCSATYRAAIVASIKASKPASKDAASDLFDAPLLGFLTAGLAVCEHNAKHADLAGAFASKVGALPTGPRGAASWAAMQYAAGHEDDFGELTISGMRDASLQLGGLTGQDDSGVVASLGKPDSDGNIAITFKKESWMETIWKCRRTNKIDSFKFDGDSVRVVYRENCVAAGEKKVSRTPSPVKVDARFAAGLAAGRMADVTYWASGTGFVREVYADKSRKQLVSYFGFAW